MTVTTDRTLEITRTGPLIGAEITGVDLNADVDTAVADRLRQAFRAPARRVAAVHDPVRVAAR